MIDCQNSMAPKDEDLLRHTLDEEPLPVATKVHLDQCALCQQRLATYIRTNSVLLIQLYRSQCPTVAELGNYCCGLLPADDEVRITRHVKLCPLCAEEATDTYRMLHSEMIPDVDTGCAPDIALQCVKASLVPRQAQQAPHDEMEVSRELSWPRQYRADEFNLSLHLSYECKGNTTLSGLITCANSDAHMKSFNGAKVELYRTSTPMQMISGLQKDGQDARQVMLIEEPLLSTYIDDSGSIVFKAVSPGMYAMIVYLPEMEMVVEGLTIVDG